jgi:hypothetical protein
MLGVSLYCMKKRKLGKRKLGKKGERSQRKVVFVRMPGELADKLRDYCSRNSISINQSVLLAVRRFLDGES